MVKTFIFYENDLKKALISVMLVYFTWNFILFYTIYYVSF